MNIKRFLQIIILSFHSSHLYLDVAKKWKHWGLGFLIRFSILTSITISVLLFILIAAANFNQLSPILEQIPKLIIKNDKASLVEPNIELPLHIKAPGADKDLIIIDLSILDAKKYHQNIIVFTEDRIAFNLIDSGNFAITYKDLLHGSNISVIDEKNLMTIIQENKKKFLGTILILGVPIISLIYFVLTLLKASMYAFFASALSKLLKYNLNFQQLTRLAIMVNTPASIISAALVLMFFNTSLFNNVSTFIIGNIYLFYFICVFTLCRQKKEP